MTIPSTPPDGGATTAPPAAGGVASILSQAALARLRAAYADAAMRDVLSGALRALYPGSRQYVDALADAFYPPRAAAAAAAAGGPPATSAAPPSPPLAAVDRERCLIALLAAKDAKRNLAVHVYAALMLGISADEICHILLLVGAYAGVEAMASGLAVAKLTLESLARTADPAAPLLPSPDVVLKVLATDIPL